MKYYTDYRGGYGAGQPCWRKNGNMVALLQIKATR